LRYRLLILLLLLPAVLPGPAPAQAARAPQPAAALPGTPMCFAQTGYCLRGVFLRYWRVNDGLAQFGYPLTPELVEDGRTVQYTERARFELHENNTVLLGLLGRSLTESRSDAPFTRAPDRGVGRYFAETGHNLTPPFLDYWQAQGGLPIYGYPVSEAFEERSPTDGKAYLVQYFQRHRLEYHPENAPANRVLLGLLGAQAYSGVYGAPPPLKPDPALTPDPVSLDALRRGPRAGGDLRVVGTLARTAAYTKYSIRYRSGSLSISGVMHVPAGNGPFPVIIMAHGYIPISEYSTGMDSKRESPFLASNGYVAIHPDFRNYAGSDDDPDALANTTTFGWTTDTLNLVAAIQASSLPYIDRSRIGLWGHSNGGQVGLQTLSLDTSIRAYVLFAPTSPDYVDNFNRWMRPESATRRAIQARHGLPEDNPAFYRGISSGPWFDQAVAPVLLFHGTGDTNTP
jgi:dienelactone hydrolase